MAALIINPPLSPQASFGALAGATIVHLAHLASYVLLLVIAFGWQGMGAKRTKKEFSPTMMRPKNPRKPQGARHARITLNSHLI